MFSFRNGFNTKERILLKNMDLGYHYYYNNNNEQTLLSSIVCA